MSSKAKLPVVLPPLASTIYSVINARLSEAKTLLLALFCKYGLDERQILNVSLK